MDKDLIRIMIFAIGLAVIIGMIVWSYLKHEKLKRYEDFDEPSSEHENSELGYNEADYEAELETTGKYEDYSGAADEYETERTTRAKAQPAAEIKKLPIIQFSIVALNREGFNGKEIFEILDDVGLEYGNLQIFERLDARRLVDFGVASMVKPGIFPSTNLAAFHCPGIVFFMQPSKVDNPVTVFDDFARTFQFVASQLGGEMWDHHREILTDETIAEIRYSLTFH
jgi:cell division protein ZipA